MSSLADYLKLGAALLFAPKDPRFANVRPLGHGDTILRTEALSLGTIVFGTPGTGKTMFLATMLLDYAIRHPDRPIFLTDKGGLLADTFLKLVLMLPEPQRRAILTRIRYDRVGDPDYTHIIPEFTLAHGGSYLDQINRTIGLQKRLNPEAVAQAPIVGKQSFEEWGYALYSLCVAAGRRLHNETLQLTDAFRLLMEPAVLVRLAGEHKAELPAVWDLFNAYKGFDLHERYLATGTLKSTLMNALSSPSMTARYGATRPSISLPECFDQGLIDITDNSLHPNDPMIRGYAEGQKFSLIKAEAARHHPGTEQVKPFVYVMDEAGDILENNSVGEEILDMPSTFRSRGAAVILAAQGPYQFKGNRKPYSFGNLVVFNIADRDEDSLLLARQFLSPDLHKPKLDPKTDTQQPVLETITDQERQMQEWIASLDHREVLVRRRLDERTLDPYVRHVRRTPDVPNFRDIPSSEVEAAKRMLLQRDGVSVDVYARMAEERFEQLKASLTRKGPPEKP